MNPQILNRDFEHPADGWYMIEAYGKHPNRAAGVVQQVDAAAGEAIVKSFNADAGAGKLRHGQEMLIDHEHFSDMPDQETRAYGWLQELQNRKDGIYGRIRWTTTGKSAVDGGDYRFFSTEYEPEDLEVLNSDKLRAVRPLRLAGLTLTNMNNNRGQKPITNRTARAVPTIENNTMSKILNGDVPGHAFHGNQYAEAHADAQKASAAADKAESKAARTNKNEDIHAALTAHSNAALAHLRAAGIAKAQGDMPAYHAHMDNYAEHQAAGPVLARKIHNRQAPANKKCPDCDVKLEKQDDGTHQCPECDETFSGSNEPGDSETKTKNRKMTKDIAKTLGLSEDAAPEAVSEAVTKLKNRAAELETANQTLLGEQVDGILAECSVTDEKIRNRLKPMLTPMKNRDERLNCLAEFGYAPGKAGATRVLNRGGGAEKVAGSGAQATDDKSTAAKIKNRAAELQGASKRSFDSCWQQAQNEILGAK